MRPKLCRVTKGVAVYTELAAGAFASFPEVGDLIVVIGDVGDEWEGSVLGVNAIRMLSPRYGQCWMLKSALQCVEEVK